MTIKHQSKLPRSSLALSYMFLISICWFLLSHNQCDKCCHKISDSTKSVTPALVVSLKTDYKCLGSSVYLLRRSRWLNLRAEWLWRAGKGVWLSYSTEGWVFGFASFPHLNGCQWWTEAASQALVYTKGSRLRHCLCKCSWW